MACHQVSVQAVLTSMARSQQPLRKCRDSGQIWRKRGPPIGIRLFIITHGNPLPGMSLPVLA